MEWKPIKRYSDLPLEQMILVAGKYGIDAIQFHSARWRYVYSSKQVSPDAFKTFTYYLIPEHPLMGKMKPYIR